MEPVTATATFGGVFSISVKEGKAIIWHRGSDQRMFISEREMVDLISSLSSAVVASREILEEVTTDDLPF